MYERRLDGQTLSFGHAGMLLHESFVMYDRQTDSLWVQAKGEAFHGPLAGKRLRLMPSTVTSWTQWKRSYPHTLVLSGKRAGPIMGGYDGFRNNRLLGLAVIVRFKGKLYPFTALERRPLLNDRFNGVELLVYFSREHATAAVWRRRMDGRVLTFRMADARDAECGALLRDEQTGSAWCWLTGEALSGPLKGRALERARYHPILNERFRAFYPHGPVFSAGGR